MKTIFLLRHCAIADDHRDRFVGQIDPPLSPAGRLAAARIGSALRQQRIEAIHCSDLQRARQTVALIAAGGALPISATRALREIALGRWEGMPRSEVAERFPSEYAQRGADLAHYRVEGGESFADCQRRVLAAWREIVASDARRIVVVGHAGANRALICALLGRPLDGLFSITQDYGAVNIVAQHGETCAVLRINADAGEFTDVANFAEFT